MVLATSQPLYELLRTFALSKDPQEWTYGSLLVVSRIPKIIPSKEVKSMKYLEKYGV